MAKLPNNELLHVLEPAYAPCEGFCGACHMLSWSPETGHIPRGFLGATGALSEVELVLVFAEPGDPHENERHESIHTALTYTCEAKKNGVDLFHRNVRQILDLCFPEESFDAQLRKTWMTESLLCSAPKEGGSVPASAWRLCGELYLKPQLELVPNALVVALGKKAQSRLESIGVPFFAAGAAAPPGCNFKGARESWQAAAEELRARRR